MAPRELGCLSVGIIKKTIIPGIIAWIKVLLTGFCPGSGSCDRDDEIRVGLFLWPITTPLYLIRMIVTRRIVVKGFERV
jgi:hypothetical protein